MRGTSRASCRASPRRIGHRRTRMAASIGGGHLHAQTQYFPLIQTVRAHGSGTCDRGSSPRWEAIDNLGRRTVPLVIPSGRMATGPRRTAGTRGADMADEEGVNEGQEPEGGQAGGEGAGGAVSEQC